jgi:5-(carboxyamino)imidazole ribonucleotide synthase
MHCRGHGSTKNELAVIVCRNPSGEIKTYTLEMEFHPEANQVEYVICLPELMIK